jgi:hypothetical protein
MADPRAETETELSPDEAARLLEAARRAEADLAAGRVYRTSEEGLEALLAKARRLDRPPPPGYLELMLSPEGRAKEAIVWAAAAGHLERADPDATG